MRASSSLSKDASSPANAFAKPDTAGLPKLSAIRFGDLMLAPVSYCGRRNRVFQETEKPPCRRVSQDEVTVQYFLSISPKFPSMTICGWRSQPVDATLPWSLLAGVSKPKVFRGR